MKVLFKLGETALDNAEASALFSATESIPSIVIDILDHINPAKINAEKLFSLSVQKKNPTLATLAAKFAIEGITPNKRRRSGDQIQRISDIRPVKEISDPSEAISELIGSDSLKSVGAAMILSSLKNKDKKTLRQIAISTVNELAYHGTISADSDCFRGFIKDADGSYRPVAKAPGISRSECYHASPVYTALRDGLALLAEWGLVMTDKTTEYGAKDRDSTTSIELLRRTVYLVELSESGLAVANHWGDLTSYISMRWSQRVRSRSSVCSF
jgi:hypothetical protein